jgi:phage tail-like protein
MSRENHPLGQFNFLVDFGDGCEAGFQELSGLDADTRVTLKRGVIAGAGSFRRWLAAIRQGRIERRAVTIRLFDEQARLPVMSWTLAGAWPAGISDGALASDAEEVAVEALELAYESITAADG